MCGVEAQNGILNVGVELAVDHVKIRERAIVGDLHVVSGEVQQRAVRHCKQHGFGIHFRVTVDEVFRKGPFDRHIRFFRDRLLLRLGIQVADIEIVRFYFL